MFLWSCSWSFPIALLWSSPFIHLSTEGTSASSSSSLPSSLSEDDELDELARELDELETELELELSELVDETFDELLEEMLETELELSELVLLASDELEATLLTDDELDEAVEVVSTARIALAVFQTKSDEITTPSKPNIAFLEKDRNTFFIYLGENGNN